MTVENLIVTDIRPRRQAPDVDRLIAEAIYRHDARRPEASLAELDSVSVGNLLFDARVPLRLHDPAWHLPALYYAVSHRVARPLHLLATDVRLAMAHNTNELVTAYRRALVHNLPDGELDVVRTLGLLALADADRQKGRL